MARPVTENTLRSRYRDDFDIEKGYHRILFNNSRPLQARELTQLQTIIQEEIKIFGKNIFKEGAAVSPGGFFLNNRLSFIKLDDTALNVTDLTRLIGRTFEGSLSSVKVKVIDAIAKNTVTGDPTTIYVQYTDTKNATASDTSITVSPGEELSEFEGSITLKVQEVNTTSNPAFGYGTRISIGAAEFFTQGFFVRAASQTIYLAKYSPLYTGNVGFRVTQEIWTTDDDISLYDNQGLLPNTTSPGADRLKINLELIDEANVDAGDTFIYYARIENSAVTDVITAYDNYNIINDYMAVRTAEESGDYTVEPFYVNFQENLTDPVNYLTLRVSTGKAYVNGYRIDKNRPSLLSVQKALDTEILPNSAVSADYGYFIVLDELRGIPDFSINEKLTISAHPDSFKWTIAEAAELSATASYYTNNPTEAPFPLSNNGGDANDDFWKIGTCRVRSLDRSSDGKYRLYIFDVQMNTETTLGRIIAGQKFSLKDHARSIGIPVGLPNEGGAFAGQSSKRVCYAKPTLIGQKVFVKEAENEDLLFRLPMSKPKDIANVRASRILRRFVASVVNNTVTLAAGSSGATFADFNSWIVARSNEPDGDGTGITSESKQILSIESYTITYSDPNNSPTATITITDPGITIPNNQEIEVLAYVTRPITEASKTVKTFTGPISDYNSDGGYFQLPHADIINVSVIKYDSSTGADASSIFLVDNGQRETHYQNGRLVKRDARTIQSGVVYVEYTYYEHSKAGDFFSINSYGPTAYTLAPKYTNKNGDVINLLEVLDFRPLMSDAFNFTSSDAAKRIITKDADVITADIEYYLPRLDKLVLNETGELTYICGNSGFTPQFPQTPLNCIELYDIKMNAFAQSASDVVFKKIENKRYTMHDINKIEKRIDELERMTALSLLELDTKNIDVLDAEGRNRTKTGFFVDNFANQFYTDFANAEYRASIDPSTKVARPAHKAKNIGLVYSPTLSTNTVLKGDNVYLNYNELRAIYHDQASRVENVNPYISVNYNGTITLSPSSDEWKETEYVSAANVIDGGTVLHNDQALLWNEWAWDWFGNNVNNLTVGSSVNRTDVTGEQNFRNVSTSGFTTTTTTGTTQTLTTTVNTVTSIDTIREVVGDRVIDVALIPFMRAKLVSFKVEGMQPNSRVFPYFDNVSVDAWCRSEEFVRISENKTELGNLYRNATEHPFGGSTELYTDSRGSCEGSFFIPSTNSIRFRSGTVEFKLLDVSGNNESGAASVARTNFVSKGLLYTRQLDVLSTRHIEVTGRSTTTTQNINVSTSSVTVTPQSVWNFDGGGDGGGPGDPLAQSFYVAEKDGIFVTKVSLYFASKDSSLPVWIQIRPMVNGYPSDSVVLPGSQKLLNSDQVAISTDASVPTNFIFDEPIYLNSNTEYCVVILSGSDEYEVWISKMGDFELGTTERRITKQAFLGSLFKSQNSFTWDASQFEDLKFDIWKADFSSYQSGTAVFVNNGVPRKILEQNPIELWYDASDDGYIRIHHPNHGHIVGDEVILSGVPTADFGEYLNDTHTIEQVDHTGYVIARPAGITVDNKPSPVSSVFIGGSTVTATENMLYNNVWPSIQTLLPNNTAMRTYGQFTSGTSYAGNETAYTQDASKQFKLKLNDNNNLDYFPRVIKNELIENSSDASKSAVITVDLSTNNSNVSPVIDMQRCSLTLIENIIDNPASSPSTGENSSISFVDETHPNGGTAASKHVTNAIRLLNTATGLSVIFAANRPSTSNIKLYYKTSIGGASLKETDWTYVDPDTATPADDNADVFREYTYTIGGTDGDMDEFDTFQLKIVFTSYNSSRVPVLRDLRAIALGD